MNDDTADPTQLFARDGHLLDLAIDRALTGDLRPVDEAAMRAHVAGCPACDGRMAGARADLEEAVPPLRLPASPTPPPAAWEAPAPANRTGRWAWIAAAAAALLVVRAASQREHLQTRGSGGPEALALEVYKAGPAGAERVFEGGVVRGGDRIGFRVRSEADGYLLVLGVDDEGSTYPCYPSADDAAAPVRASSTPEQLDAAVRVDGAARSERLVAIRCDAPFTLDDVVARLSAAHDDKPLPALRDGCAQDEVSLVEEAGPR